MAAVNQGAPFGLGRKIERLVASVAAYGWRLRSAKVRRTKRSGETAVAAVVQFGGRLRRRRITDRGRDNDLRRHTGTVVVLRILFLPPS